jgi:hypothetical protein
MSVLALRTAAELLGSCQVSSRCDIDGNGAITVTDGVAALRLAAGLPVELKYRDVVVDRSDFTSFTFDRRSAFGFCPPLGSFSRLLLSVEEGSVVRIGDVIVESEPGTLRERKDR